MIGAAAASIPRRRWPRVSPGVLFALPALFLVMAFAVYPLVYNLYVSLTDASAFRQITSFVGVHNYRQLVSNPVFWKITGQTALWALLTVSLQMVGGLVAALLFARPGLGRGFFVGVTLSSWATSYVVVAILGRWMFDSRLGVVNDLLLRSGAVGDPVNWFSSQGTAFFALVVMNAWKYFPFVMLMYLAALQGIPVELYESAQIDGASFLRRFTDVTLPMLAPVTAAAAFLTTIWAFNAFTIIWVMTAGGPLRSTETLPIAIYRLSFSAFNYGSAAAASVVLFAMVLILAVAYFRYGNRADV
jgi:multiple sugar transport system permease protein